MAEALPQSEGLGRQAQVGDGHDRARGDQQPAHHEGRSMGAGGANAAALAMGGLLVAACAIVTVTNLCLPSEAFAMWERLRRREELRSA